MNYTYTSLSKAGLRRKENEDALRIFNIEGGVLAIICGGLGGVKAGGIASELSVRIIYNTFKILKNYDYLQRIKIAIEDTNRIIHEESLRLPQLRGMATTAGVLFLHEQNAYLGYVGDLRIYCFKENKLEQLTKDHSLVQELLDNDIISAGEMKAHSEKNILTHALGGSPLINADVKKIEMNSDGNYLFMLCSDGVTAEVDNSELEEILSLNSFNEISDELSSLIENRGAPDNYSYVLIEKVLNNKFVEVN